MPHISKRAMKKEVAQEVSSKFSSVLLRLQKHGGHSFIQELFTPTEQIMLAKRLAIIFMLREHRTYYNIIKTLKVSTSTSKRMHEALILGKYKTIERAFSNQKRRDAFFAQLEAISRGGLPPRAGKRVWGVHKKKSVL